MNSKSQISIFVIIGLVLVLAVFLVVFSINRAKIEKFEYSGEIKVIKEGVSTYIDSCVEEVTTEAMVLHGLKKPGLVEEYLKNELNNCFDSSIYENMGASLKLGEIKTKVEVTYDSVIVTVDYPITIEHDSQKAELKQFTYTLPRTTFLDLEYDTDGRTLKHYVLNTADRSYTLTIPKGTKVTGPPGIQPQGVMLRLVDKNDNAQLNPVVFGLIVEGIPSGISFEPAAELVVDLKNLDPSWTKQDIINEFSIFYRDTKTNIWQELETEVKGNYYLESKIHHFTYYTGGFKDRCAVNVDFDYNKLLKFSPRHHTW